MSIARIALIGAGFTIERVARRVPEAETVIATRSQEKVAEFRARGFSAEQVDIADWHAVNKFFSHHPRLQVIVDSVPPLSGEIHPGGSPADGAAHIVHGARAHCPALRHIIYLSTTGVYGVDDGSVVEETSTEKPRTGRGANRLLVEESYRASGFKTCALRIAAIYGEGRGIGHALRDGRYPLIEDGSRWSNRIHVEDLSAAIAAAIAYQGVLPRAINLSDDEPARTSDVIQYYCTKFSFQAPHSITLSEARNRGLETLLSNQRVSNELLKRTLLPSLKYPTYREGAESEFAPAV